MRIKHKSKSNLFLTGINYEAGDSHLQGVMACGAKRNGLADDLNYFQECIVDDGVAYAPGGTYYLSALPQFTASGQGLIGDGIGKTILIVSDAGLRAASGLTLENIQVRGLTIQADEAALTTSGQQAWVDATAVDLSNIGTAVVRDVKVYKFRTPMKLHTTDATHKSMYNHIENLVSWGAETGIHLGGINTPVRSGANANKFIGCKIIAAKIAIIVAGGFNSFSDTKIECPLQTAGYPAAATGIRFDSGFYGLSNTFIDTYCELVGVGNKGIHAYYTEEAGAWLTPNYFIGGHFGVNAHPVNNPSGLEIPTFDSEVANSVYGFHFDVSGIVPTRRLSRTPDGTLIQETYPNGGGVLQTDTSGNIVYSSA